MVSSNIFHVVGMLVNCAELLSVGQVLLSLRVFKNLLIYLDSILLKHISVLSFIKRDFTSLPFTLNFRHLNRDIISSNTDKHYYLETALKNIRDFGGSVPSL